MDSNKFRLEEDALGKKGVPAEAYYGIQTQRARDMILLGGLLPYIRQGMKGIGKRGI